MGWALITHTHPCRVLLQLLPLLFMSCASNRVEPDNQQQCNTTQTTVNSLGRRARGVQGGRRRGRRVGRRRARGRRARVQPRRIPGQPALGGAFWMRGGGGGHFAPIERTKAPDKNSASAACSAPLPVLLSNNKAHTNTHNDNTAKQNKTQTNSAASASTRPATTTSPTTVCLSKAPTSASR